MAATRDLVVQVTADTSGLASGMAKGAQSLSAMEKQARETERQIKKIGEAGASFQRLVNDFAGVTQAQQGTARASAEAFQEFARLQDAVDDLRGSMDPAYAATKRYEAALGTLDSALARGVLSADDHAASVKLLDAEMTGATKGAGGFQNAARGVAQQLSQVGQQTMATGNFVQALAIQLPDLGLAFGAAGAAAGLLAGVALPVLMSAMGNTEEAAKQIKDAVEKSEAAISAMHQAAQDATQPMADLATRYGLAATEAKRFLATVSEAKDLAAMEAVKAEITSIADGYGRLVDRIQGKNVLTDFGISLDMTVNRAVAIQRAMDAMAKADGLQAQYEAAADLHDVLMQVYQNLDRMPPQMRALADQTAGAALKALQFRDPIERVQEALAKVLRMDAGSDFLSNAIDKAETLWGKIRGAAAAAMAADLLSSSPSLSGPAGMATGETPEGRLAAKLAADQAKGEAVYGTIGDKPGKKGGGGGGGGDKLQGQIDSLLTSLKTKEQIELEQYAKDQEALQLALDKKMVTLEQYQAATEQLQRDHQDRMSEIDVMRYGDAAQQTAAYFGVMQTALQNGNEKMQKAARIFGAAEALINAWRGYAQTMADPSLPFFAKFAAGASVLSAGFAAVNAIKGGGSGSGGGRASAASSASASAAQAPMQVSIQTTGGGSSLGVSSISDLFDKLNAEAGDRGYKIVSFA